MTIVRCSAFLPTCGSNWWLQWAADPTSEDTLLLRLFADILEVRLQWYIHSPEQLNVQVAETFSNLYDVPGSMPAHRWNDRVLIDSDCSSDSLLRAQCFMNTILDGLKYEENTATAAAHPLSILVVYCVEQALREWQGLKLTVANLRQHRRNCFQRHEALDSVNFLRPLPYGFESFMEYAQDVTICTALLRTQAREAEELVRRQQRERRAQNQARRAQKRAEHTQRRAERGAMETRLATRRAQRGLE